MELDELIQIYDQDQRRDLVDPRYRREEDGCIVRAVSLIPGRLAFVTYSQFDKTTAETAIQGQIDYFSGLGLDFEWKLFHHDRPPDLKERLRDHGFEIEEEEGILILELDQTPTGMIQPGVSRATYPAEDPIQVTRLTDPDGLEVLVRVMETVWEVKMPWLYDHLGVYLRDYPSMLSVYLASWEGALASVAWTFFLPDSAFASLWGGSTLTEFRKKGLYTRLLSVRLQEAQQRGRRFATVDASSMSQPILEKFGFRLLDESTPCKWKVNR